ncbi:MAG: hypothetical protein ACR2LF_10280, partial [Jatrophihabitantaceae bacterium]
AGGSPRVWQSCWREARAGRAPRRHRAGLHRAGPRIDELSGMVDLGSLTVVTIDSGDTGRVFVLDARGRTVGVTTYAGCRSRAATTGWT